MTRTLTAGIIAAKDLTAYKPVFVVVVTDGTNVLGRYTNYAPTLADWDGSSDAIGDIVKISDIRHEVDWRGGLSHMSELTIELIDDGTLAAALAVAHPYYVEVWVCLSDGTPTKAKSIMPYLGALDSYEIGWGGVVLKTSDIRERRYPKTVLTKVGIDNETALCGYGLERSSDTEWDVDIVFHEEWIPDNAKGELIPICFNQVRKARGVLVSKWIGADDLDDGDVEGGRYLRGPLFLFSDPRLTYGDDSDNIAGLGTLYHFDTSRKTYYPLTTIGHANINDPKTNYADEFGDQLVAIFRPIDDGMNALKEAEAVNFIMRLKPRTEDIVSANVANNPLVMRTGIDSVVYNGMRREWVSAATPTEHLLSQKLADTPMAERVRQAWHEVNIEVASGALAGSMKIGTRLNGYAKWGIYMNYVDLLTSAVTLFNNWEGSAGANKAFSDAPVTSGGANPFAYGGTVGPLPISEFTDMWFELHVEAAGSTTTAEVRYYGGNFIVAADVQLDDVRLVADVDSSFDTYACEQAAPGLLSTYLSSSHCICQGSIYAVLAALFGLSTTDDIADDAAWAPIVDAAVPYTSFGAEGRLDFQLAEDLSGKDLIDRMCRDASLWIVHDKDGKEVPRKFRRVDDTTNGPHAAAIDQDRVKTGSFGPIRQGSVDDLYNRFRVRYLQNPTTGDYEKELWADESSGNLSASYLTLVNGWCTASQADYGHKRELVIEAPCIQDPLTAEALLVSLAAKHVRRPRMFGLTTWLNALDLEPCDIPCIDHPLWKIAAKKCGAATGTYSTPSADHHRLAAGAAITADVQRGDWCHITSAALITDGLAGWYRVREFDAANGYVYLFAATLGATTYTNVTWYVMPALMVAGANLRPGTAEIDLEFVEIVKAPESIGDAWAS